MLRIFKENLGTWTEAVEVAELSEEKMHSEFE